jgi:hypothetical protein
MRFRNIKSWKDIEKKRGLLFFVQRLDELTFFYSLDSYKSPTTSLRGLIYEALHLVRESLDLGTDRLASALNSADHIIDEIKVRIRGNWIARRCITVDIDELLSLDSKKTKASIYVKSLTIIGADLDEELYLAEIVDQVIAIASNAKEKSKLDFLAKEFVSILQGRGMSRDHINQSITDFFFGIEEVSDVNCLKKFCQIVYPHHHKYIVVLGADDSFAAIDHDSMARRDMINANEEEVFDDFNFELDSLKIIRKKNGLNNIVIAKVEATDYNSAVLNAKSRLDDTANFYRIFSHKSDFQTGNHALVEQACCEGLIKQVTVPQNHMHFIRDMRQSKASSVFKRFDDSITLDVGPDYNKFRNIVNIHGLSLSADSSDIQLVNIWTCLETITPSDGLSSNVSSVIGKVMPVILLGYYNRLVVNLLFDILRWDRRGFTASMKLANIEKLTDIRERFIALLSNKENEVALADLYDRCRDFELLRYRIYTISSILKNSKSAKEKLELHANMVKWQLYRIYRTRNRIVHAGDSPEFTRYLVENAHDFFDIVLMFCMELSAWKHGFDSFHACFGYAEAAYQKYIGKIGEASPNEIAWALPKNKDKSFIFEPDLDAL